MLLNDGMYVSSDEATEGLTVAIEGLYDVDIGFIDAGQSHLGVAVGLSDSPRVSLKGCNCSGKTGEVVLKSADCLLMLHVRRVLIS